MWPCDQKVVELLSISHHSAKFGGHTYCGSSDISFFSFVSWQRNQKVTWVWRWGSSIPIYHSTQFGDHRYCKSADIIFTFTTCTEGNVTWCVGFLTVSYHFAKFDGHWYWYCGSADVSFFHLSRDHVIKKSHDFEGKVFPPPVTNNSCLVTIGIAEV